MHSVAFSRDGHMLASGTSGGMVRLWNVTDPAQPRRSTRSWPAHRPVHSVALSPDGRTLASSDRNGTIRLWNIAGPAYLGGSASPSPAAALRSTRWLSAATGTRWPAAVRRHDPAVGRHRPHRSPALGQPLTGSTVAVDSVAFSPDGHTLASGSDDGTTRLWNLSVQSAINRICAVAGGLAPQQWNQYIRQLPYRTTCVH